jgi:membrane-associated protein
MTGVVDAVLDFLDGLPLWGVVVAVGVFAALEVSVFVGVFVPGDLVVLFGASTVDSPAHFAALVAAVTLGSLTGETVGYVIGHRYGERLRASRAGRWVGESRWQKTQDFLHNRGGRALVAARFIAAVHAVLPMVAGMVKMPYRRFITFCAIGAVLWSLVYVSIGTAAGASYRHIAENLDNASWVVGGVLVVAALVFFLVHKRRGKGDGDDDASGGETVSSTTEPREGPADEDDDRLTQVSLLSLPGSELLATRFASPL